MIYVTQENLGKGPKIRQENKMKIIIVEDTKGNSYDIKVDSEDYDELMKYQWIWRDGYAVRKMNGSYYGQHRHIAGALFKEDIIIDHIDNDHQNNQRSNLRRANRFENQQNRKTNVGNTLPKGVRLLPSKKYNVRVQYYNKRIGGGTFDTLEEAIEARNKLAREYHGEFFNASYPIENV